MSIRPIYENYREFLRKFGVIKFTLCGLMIGMPISSACIAYIEILQEQLINKEVFDHGKYDKIIGILFPFIWILFGTVEAPVLRTNIILTLIYGMANSLLYALMAAMIWHAENSSRFVYVILIFTLVMAVKCAP